jgi:hypothetical protein
MRLAIAILAVSLLGACASSPRQTAQAGSPTLAGTTSPDASNANFFLTISNQSFKESSVAISVVVDGARVVDQRFEVGNQHNFPSFSLDLDQGRHTLLALKSSGTKRQASFEIPANGKRYGVLFYWNDDQNPYFSWQFQATPPAFG